MGDFSASIGQVISREGGMSKDDRDALEERASCLINPASGIANDYLNVFNEALLLVENLPVLLPDMVTELLEWCPVSYVEYFRKSPLPGSRTALAAYERLDPRLRVEFERSIDDVTAIAVEGIERVRECRTVNGEIVPEDIAEHCEELARRLRQALKVSEDLVNHGRAKSGGGQEDTCENLRASA